MGAASTAQTLVLVSIDGFRWDYLDWPQATNIRSIAAQGSRVIKLRTVYPSKTFPGHLSIATGLHPTQHGVIDNYFCRGDRTDGYNMGKRRKDPSWLAGFPLWILVEQQGGRASAFFWPESDASLADRLPTDYRPYDGRVPYRERVQQAIELINTQQDADINLMLVSDHGMSEVIPDLFIDTNTLPRPKGFRRVNGARR